MYLYSYFMSLIFYNLGVCPLDASNAKAISTVDLSWAATERTILKQKSRSANICQQDRSVKRGLSIRYVIVAITPRAPIILSRLRNWKSAKVTSAIKLAGQYAFPAFITITLRSSYPRLHPPMSPPSPLYTLNHIPQKIN